MVQDENEANDGADEQMLGTEKRDNVKFTKNGDAQNGDAKIEIGIPYDGKDFTGMSKEELMKYANDPLWIRLRWIFFIAFWVIWICMLVGAILIIVAEPKCDAPKNLSWFKRGPLLKISGLSFDPDTIQKAEKLAATGVIYELPPKKTYDIGFDEKLDAEIEELIDCYKHRRENVIFDITPNYVPASSKLFQEALEDETKRSAFVWVKSQEVPTNWVSLNNSSAWKQFEANSYILSQFGDDLYDLHMNTSVVKSALTNVLENLLKKGVKGFRFKNSKFFILSKDIEDDSVAQNTKYDMKEYGFWTHTHTSLPEGLGDFLSEFKAKLKVIDEDVLVTVADDMVRPEIYKTKEGFFGIDTPKYGRLMNILNKNASGEMIQQEFENIRSDVGKNAWLQWELDDLKLNKDVDPSSLVLFLSLIPGVDVIAYDSVLIDSVSSSIYKEVHDLRSSPSFMHGEFVVYPHGKLVAYSRIKSGNPGYFVVFNPTNEELTKDFTKLTFPEKMRVKVFSSNYNVSGVTVESQMNTNTISLSPISTIIFSYVPVNSG